MTLAYFFFSSLLVLSLNSDHFGLSAAHAGDAPAAKKRHLVDRLEASVNSSIILLSDVEKFREVVKLRGQLDPLFSGTPLARDGENAASAQIVDFLVDERMITQEFPKSDEDVEKEVRSIESHQHLTRDTLIEALAREGYKFSDYFEMIRDSSSKRDLIDREIRTKVSISEDDIKNHFYNHYARSTEIPRAFHLALISLATTSYKDKNAAFQIITSALKEVKAGEPFEEVARRINDDGSAAQGGNLGILKEDEMSPAIRSQAKKLKIGEVSGIFESDPAGRYYILKLIDVQSAEADRLEKMKDEIRGQLAAAEYQHQISLWLERQRQKNFIHKSGNAITKEIPVVR